MKSIYYAGEPQRYIFVGIGLEEYLTALSDSEPARSISVGSTLALNAITMAVQCSTFKAGFSLMQSSRGLVALV